MNQPLVSQGQNANMPAHRNLGQLIANLGPKSQLASQSTVDPRGLASGIKPSFASITFKGKTWGIRHRGVTHNLLVRDPQTGQVLGSAPSIDLVLLKSALAISKSYYIEKYKDGDFNQPDCWSTNGMAPDPAAPRKQNPTCRGCKWDAFGSRMTEDNRKGKACSDNKRIAVVPAADLKNEIYGGPMLLKLPPSAFAGLSELEAQLLQQGYEYFSVVMRLTFDHQAAFPKIVFTPIGVLNDYQMQEVVNLQQLDVIDRILNEELFEVAADPNQPTDEAAKAQPLPVAQPQPIHAVPEHQPEPQPAQALQTVAPQPQPVATGALDPGPIPAHLVRPLPQGNGAAPAPVQPLATGPTEAVQQVQPTVAPQPIQTAQPLQAAQPAPAQPVETAEQKIARLEAALAAASAKPATRKRSKPVTPTGNGEATVVPPQGAQPAPLTTAQSTLPSGTVASTPEQMRAIQQNLPGESIVDVEDDDQGDAPADLDSRIDALMGTVQS